jgi:hypothetical protein
MEDRMEQFLTQSQINSLESILGKSMATEMFIAGAELSIEVSEKTKIRPNKDRQNDLAKIKKTIDTLLPLLELININRPELLLDTSILYDEVMADRIISELNDELGHSGKYSHPKKPPFQPLIDELNLIKDASIAVSKNAFISKRGSRSAHENRLQILERLIIHTYIDVYGCRPAKTVNGAFHSAMNIIYEAAGYTTANSYERLIKSLNTYPNYELSTENNLQTKPIRGLHSNSVDKKELK